MTEVARRSNGSRTPHRRRNVQYVTDVQDLEGIPPEERRSLEAVAERFPFRANDYYLGLIDWNDPEDPIRRLVVPTPEELKDWGELDASNEAAVTVARGVQHKYRRTVLLLCNEVCGAFCRYCFRKRLFQNDNDEAALDIADGLDYIAEHPEVTNVLLTGGDPLLMSTRRIRMILAELGRIPHVRIVRIGSKMPAFNPWRVLDDPALLDMFRQHQQTGQRLYVMAHFDHPRELTRPAREGLQALAGAGVTVVNQCPLIKGVNDSARALGDLFQRMSWVGVQPYYLFQCRPTAGNEPYAVPLAEGFRLFSEARRRGSGLGRRARYVMSHATGKIAMVGMDERHFYLRYHQAKDPRDEFRFMTFHRDDAAVWADDLVAVGEGIRQDALEEAHSGLEPSEEAQAVDAA